MNRDVRMMMRTTVVLCAMIVASGCASDEAESEAESDTLALQSCSARTGDTVYLAEVSDGGNYLLTDVKVGGGCGKHTFSACWSGEVLDSYPPTVIINLSHDGHGDHCDALLSRSLRIDITRVLESTGRPVHLSVSGVLPVDGATNSVTLSD